MITLRENATHILLTGEANELDRLSEIFQYHPNGYVFARSYERYIASGRREGWDGFIRPLHRLTATSGQILRGYRTRLLQEIEDEGFKLSAERLLTSPFAGLTVEDVPPDVIESPFPLDEFQRQCIADWLAQGVGVNNVTVGGGKTAALAGAAKLIKDRYPKGRFLYLTPSERLVRQATKEMRKFLPGWDIGQMGGGVRQEEAKDMVICTVAMLSKHFARLKSSKFFDSFISILYDEVHHCGSKTSQRLLLEIPAFFRLGASDTTKEDDPTRFNAILGLFGSVLNKVTAEPLIERGRIAVPHIYIVDNPNWLNRFQSVRYSPLPNSKGFVLLDGKWTPAVYKGQVYERDEDGNIKFKTVTLAEKDEQGEWKKVQEPIVSQGLHTMEIDGETYEIDSRWCLLDRAYDKAIIQFKERNDTIIKWASHFSGKGYPTLVVCTRTLHIYILESLFKKAVDPELVQILFGWASPKERDATFDWFRNTPGSILITPLVKEGVSINEIRAMVVADFVSNWEVGNQIIGRAIRQKKGERNRAEIVWFRDNQHPSMRAGCAKLFKRLQQIRGYEFYDPAPMSPEDLESATPLPRQMDLI